MMTQQVRLAIHLRSACYLVAIRTLLLAAAGCRSLLATQFLLFAACCFVSAKLTLFESCCSAPGNYDATEADGDGSIAEQFETAFRRLWRANGDHIAIQYAGSGALLSHSLAHYILSLGSDPRPKPALTLCTDSSSAGHLVCIQRRCGRMSMRTRPSPTGTAAYVSESRLR